MASGKGSARPFRLDAGEDQVDAGQEILAVVVRANLVGQAAGEGEGFGIQLGPGDGDLVEEAGALDVQLLRDPCVRRVLRAHAEDIAQQRLDRAPRRAFGHLQRANLLADALQQAIAASPGDIEAALAAYERELFPRSAAEAQQAEPMLTEVCLGAEAPWSLVDFFIDNQPV